MGFRKNLGNRTLNTIGVAPRTVGAGINTICDATKTALYGVLDPFEGIGKVASGIKDAVHKAFTTGKRYNKLWKIPTSIIGTIPMAAIGLLETAFYTGSNLVRNTRDTIANPFINIGHGIKRMGSSQKVGNFSFAKINNKTEVNPRNRLANMSRWTK